MPKKNRNSGKPNGRPPFVVNYDTLEKLCLLQCTGEECASVLGVTYDCLNRRLKEDFEQECEENQDLEMPEGGRGFKEYYAVHALKGHVALRRMQWRTAENGNAQMQKLLGQNWLGQSEKINSDINANHTGQVNVSFIGVQSDGKRGS